MAGGKNKKEEEREKKASPGSVGSGRSGNKFRMENLRLCPKGECDPDWSKHTGRSNESNRNRANNRIGGGCGCRCKNKNK